MNTPTTTYICSLIQVQEIILYKKIFQSENPIDELDIELNKKKSLLLEITDEARINKLVELILGELDKAGILLEDKARKGEPA